MALYAEFKSKVVPGEKIVTQHNIIPGFRVVTVTEGKGIECEGHSFHWDTWFAVNHPLELQAELIAQN